MNQLFIYSCVALTSLLLIGCSKPKAIEPPMITRDSQTSEEEIGVSKITVPSRGSEEAPTELSKSKSSQQRSIVFGDEFPKVLAVDVKLLKEDSWQFNVKLSSPYDSPQRFADAWRVLDENEDELGIRVLGHDHANEQPFIRSHSIKIPSGTRLVFVEGRDQVNGWSGQRFEVKLP